MSSVQAVVCDLYRCVETIAKSRLTPAQMIDLAGAMKKAGYSIESLKSEKGERSYRINP